MTEENISPDEPKYTTSLDKAPDIATRWLEGEENE